MRNLANISAEDLMLTYQADTPDEAFRAFSELYSRYNQRVFQYLSKKVKNRADCEDLLQKIFIKVHESKHLYKNKYKFEQWLFVIAKTQSLDHFRSSTRSAKKIGLYQEDVATLVNVDEVDLSFFEVLKNDERELLEMKYIDELSYQEISTLVDKSEVSLRKAVSRIVARFKKGEVYE